MELPIEEAVDIVKAAGYVVLKEKSYRAAQERQRVAQCLKEYAEENRERAYVWARDCLAEERRLRERITFVYGVARAHGATVDELRGPAARAAAPAARAGHTETEQTEEER